MKALFPAGEIDLAFIGTGPFAAAREKSSFEALATPIVRGEPFRHAHLIIPFGSAAARIEDQRGRVFAFTDPDSNTGAKVPRFWLAEISETPESFFRRTIFTDSHDNSILAAAKGLVDGASVDGHQWEHCARSLPALISGSRVLRKSPPCGSPPVVAASRRRSGSASAGCCSPCTRAPQGRPSLKRLLIDRFVPPREEW